MTEPPETTRPYRQTPDFTATTVPAGLLRDHATKADVWGVIHVSQGKVLLTFTQTGLAQRIAAGQRAVIAPEQRHFVSLSDDAVFHVAFWR